MALEHNMVGVIVAAARDWAEGGFSTAGCTLEVLAGLRLEEGGRHQG